MAAHDDAVSLNHRKAGSMLSAKAAAAAVAVVFVLTATAVAADVVLSGTPGDDVLAGGPVGESIYGLEGNDTVNGGGGDDELDGGPGADRLAGGDGNDVVSYGGTAPVNITLDGVANDGAAGEGDDVADDVEDLFGTEAGDRIVGNGSANTIDGAGGNDTIDGAGGADTLIGGDGDDTISAQDGTIDRIDCGPGNDKATLDPEDVAVGCETRETPSSPKFEPSFATARFGKRGGRLLGVPKLTGVLPGARVAVRCLSGCSLSRSFTYTAKRKGITFSRPVRITRASRVRVVVTSAGRAPRFADYRFKWKSTLIQATQYAGGCSSDTRGRKRVACS